MDTQEQVPNQVSPKKQNTIMAVFAYLGPLVIVSYIAAKDDPFVKFHIKQGLVLFVAEIVISVFRSMIWPLFVVFQLLNIATFVLSIIGIVNVSKGKETPLPIIGDCSKYFTF